MFVETLDKCFENVCELDLIFHMDKVSVHRRSLFYTGILQVSLLPMAAVYATVSTSEAYQ